MPDCPLWSRCLSASVSANGSVISPVILEVGGAALLLWPPTTALGALLLTIVSVGALLAQLLVLHEDVIHCIVLAMILATVVWTQR